MQTRSRDGARRKAIEHRRLDETVFVMTFFRPRIREEKKDFSEPTFFRKREQKLRRFCLEKCEIPEPGEFPLAVRAFDTLGNQIEPETKFLRERRRIRREKMSVPATDFERQRTRSRDDIGGERFEQFRAELRDAVCALFHGECVIGHNEVARLNVFANVPAN